MTSTSYDFTYISIDVGTDDPVLITYHSTNYDCTYTSIDVGTDDPAHVTLIYFVYTEYQNKNKTKK